MMTVHCDRWLGANRGGPATTACIGAIPPGGSYWTIDASGQTMYRPYGSHFCRPCMQAAVAELVTWEDLDRIEVRKLVTLT